MTKFGLPKPSGKYSIGFYDSFYEYTLGGNQRAVGYRLFYPADNCTGQDAYYFVDDEMHNAFIDANPNGYFNEIVKEFTQLKINSKKDAHISDGKFEVIIYSHSFGSLPWSNIVQIENLVSNGYIVAAISQTGDTFSTMLGNRRINRDMDTANKVMQELIGYMIDDENGGKKAAANYTPDDVSEYLKKCTLVGDVIKRWTENLSSLIDELKRLNKEPESILFDKLYTEKVGIFGHSLGGAAALNTGLYDHRVGAAINLDGWQMGANLLENHLDVPGLFITKNRAHYQGNYGTHNDLIDCIQIKGSSNLMMSDYNILFEKGIKELEGNQDGIEGGLMATILSDIIHGFFNKHIKQDDHLMNKYIEKYGEYLVLGKEGLFV